MGTTNWELGRGIWIWGKANWIPGLAVWIWESFLGNVTSSLMTNRTWATGTEVDTEMGRIGISGGTYTGTCQKTQSPKKSGKSIQPHDDIRFDCSSR